MNICVLDGHALNPGDLSWDALNDLGPCSIHDRTPPDEVAARAAGAGVVPGRIGAIEAGGAIGGSSGDCAKTPDEANAMTKKQIFLPARRCILTILKMQQERRCQ